MTNEKSNQPTCEDCHANLHTPTFSAKRETRVKLIGKSKLFTQDMLIEIGLAKYRSVTSPILNRLIRAKEIYAVGKLNNDSGPPTEIFTSLPDYFSHRFADHFALSEFLTPWLDIYAVPKTKELLHPQPDDLVYAHFLFPHAFCTPPVKHTQDEVFHAPLYNRDVIWIWLTEEDRDETLESSLESLHPFATLVVFVVPERTDRLRRRLRSLVPNHPSHYWIAEQYHVMGDVTDLNNRQVSLSQLFYADACYVHGPDIETLCGSCDSRQSASQYCLHHDDDACSFDHPMLDADLTDSKARFQASWHAALVSSAIIEGKGDDVSSYIQDRASDLLQKYGASESAASATMALAAKEEKLLIGGTA